MARCQCSKRLDYIMLQNAIYKNKLSRQSMLINWLAMFEKKEEKSLLKNVKKMVLNFSMMKRKIWKCIVGWKKKYYYKLAHYILKDMVLKDLSHAYIKGKVFSIQITIILEWSRLSYKVWNILKMMTI
jgi:hypothetical protein